MEASSRDEHGLPGPDLHAAVLVLRLSGSDLWRLRHRCLASREPAGALEDYEDLLGEEFDTPAVEWRQFLVESYRNIPDREAKAERFRTESPIQHMPVCGAEDY